jgi:amicyanin
MKKLILYTLILGIILFAGCASNQLTETTTSTIAETTTTLIGATASSITTIADTIPSTTTAISTVQTTSTTQETTTATQPVVKTISIDISGFAFKPSNVNINKGDTVVWTNKDSAPHTVTSVSGDELDSQIMGGGQTYNHTFQTAGTYPYYCTLHPSMKAKIKVE